MHGNKLNKRGRMQWKLHEVEKWGLYTQTGHNIDKTHFNLNLTQNTSKNVEYLGRLTLDMLE